MTRFLSNLPATRARIAIVRLTDPTALLSAIPALRALRSAAPSAHFALVGLPASAPMALRFPAYIDEFIAVDELTDRTGLYVPAFDVAIQLQAPSDELDGLTAQLDARSVAGFCHGAPNGASNGTTLRVEWPEQGPEVLRLLLLIRALGIRDQGEAMEFPLSAADRAELESCREAMALLGGPFVCIQPGARSPEHRWQAARYARVADALAVHGLRVALTGTEADQAVADTVAARMRTLPINLTGRLTMGSFAALLDFAYLLISNDTGVTRLAEAIGTPAVTIATGSDVPLWRPADRARYRVLWLPGTERPSAERLYSSWPDTGSGISVEAVLDACDVLLAEQALKQRAAVRSHLARVRREARLARPLIPQPRTEAPMVRRAS